jgi:hypothetical protein
VLRHAHAQHRQRVSALLELEGGAMWQGQACDVGVDGLVRGEHVTFGMHGVGAHGTL